MLFRSGQRAEAHPLTVGDVTDSTARLYFNAFCELSEFVSVVEPDGLAGVLQREGGLGITRWTAKFLRARFDRKRRSKVGKAGHVVSAVRRWLMLLGALGQPIPDLVSVLRPLRRMLRVWEIMTPSEFRRPVWRQVALSLAALALLEGRPRVCILILLQFHGLLRPSEARHVRWSDIGILSGHDQQFYTGTFAVVGIAQPKTRRMSTHAMHQYVTVESRLMSVFLRNVTRLIPPTQLNERIWPGSAHPLRMWWLRAMSRLQLLDLNLTWAGLRAGGATDYWLRTSNLPALRRRLRHRNEQTLERYVQESVFIQCSQRVSPRVSETLRRISELSGTLFSETPESCLIPERVDVLPVHPGSSSSSSDSQ